MNTRMARAGLLLAFASLAGTAYAQEGEAERAAAGTAASDSTFLKTAIEGNLAEVQMGTLAEQRSSGEVQEYADMLVKEHRRALDRTTSIAETLNMTIPEEPPADAKAKYARLAEASGGDFERQFVDTMVKNHQETIKKYRSYLENAGSDSAVADYAEQTLPVLEKHLQAAQSLQEELSSTSSALEPGAHGDEAEDTRATRTDGTTQPESKPR